jgi:hypothetical protein
LNHNGRYNDRLQRGVTVPRTLRQYTAERRQEVGRWFFRRQVVVMVWYGRSCRTDRAGGGVLMPVFLAD